MLRNSYKIMFFFTLMIGTLITISSTSWLSAWIGLEINLLSFIPLLKNNKNIMSSESSLKYFLVQALASSTLVFSMIMMMNYYNYMNSSFSLSNPLNLMLMAPLMMKTGMAPFHSWFPSIIEGLNWENSFIMFTWQKIAPMILLSYTPSNFLIIPVITCVIIGSIGGLNQTSLRKILAYSSINHLGWMSSALMISLQLWTMYFMFYSLLLTPIIMLFLKYNLFYISQVFSLSLKSKYMKMFLFCNFLSLGGLPPFIGFFPKWNIIQTLTEINQNLMLMIMIMCTLITLFYYLRITISSFLMFSYKNKWDLNKNYKNFNSFYLMSSCSILGLPIMNLII